MRDDLTRKNLWFAPDSLRAFVDAGTLERGRAMYCSQRVLDLQIELDGDNWILEGEVQGSQRRPYSVTIELQLTPQGDVADWVSDCTCPVGVDCKHGVALTLKAAYHGLRLLGPRGGQAAAVAGLRTPEDAESARRAMQARMEELERLQAEAQLLQWLESMDRAMGQPGKTPSRKSEQYLFLAKATTPTGQPSQLRLEAVTSVPRVAGGWTQPKAIRTPPRAGNATFDHASDTDREVLQLLMTMPGKGTYYSGYSALPAAILEGQAGRLALELAASTGRLYTCTVDNTPGTALQWGPAQSLDWSWNEVTSTNGTPSWVLRARLHTESLGERSDAAGAKLLLNHPPFYLDFERGLCGLVHAPGISDAQLAVLLKAPPLKPAALEKHQQALLQRLATLPAPPMLAQLSRIIGVKPTACLHLSPHPPALAAHRGLICAELRFDYEGCKGWWAGQGASVIVDGPQGRTLLHRDSQAELDAIARLMDLGLAAHENGEFGLPPHGPQDLWLQWADDAYRVLHDAGFAVTLDDALQNWISHADQLDMHLRAPAHGTTAPGADPDAPSPWFDLSLGMEINGQRHNILPLLPQLIAATAHHPSDPATGQPYVPPFVYLPNPHGSGYVRLPTEPLKPWMAALLELVGDRGHDFSGDSLRLSRLDALRTSAALGEGVAWEGAQALRALVQQLAGRAAIAEAPVPATVQASLRPYQQQGVNWLQFLRTHGLSGILADDMGLGKTLQTLVHIQIEKDAGRLNLPALIIAPVSLMGNWRQEAARFCPSLRTLVLHGKDRHDVAGEMGSHDIVIAPYSLLQRDKERWLEQSWHLVVLDEAQNIKNANTHAAQVVGQLQARHRLCLSGTPMENHLGEIWSLFHFLMPGFLGSQMRFKELFRTPIEREGDAERLTQLRARVTPFMLRRTKALVAHELPPKVETVMRVELSGKQADLYETIRLGMEKSVREALNTKGLAKSQITILDALLKLRQVCCDPGLVKLDAAKKVKTSAKLEQLMELLPEMVAEGRKILLFSQFTTMLTLIEAELKKHKIGWVKLTGQSQKRDDIIARFTSGEVPVFLISLKAGGVGLNLPQADTVIHYDPWWNPAVEAQATDRAHRIGQTQSVWVVKLVAQGTIEERILALQERKAALADSMYSGSAARKEPLFNENDLAELLKPLG